MLFARSASVLKCKNISILLQNSCETVHWRSELRELLAPTLRLKPVWTRLVGLEVPDLANFHCSGNSAHTFQVENMGLVQASLQSCVLTCTRDAGFVIMFTLKTRRIMCSSLRTHTLIMQDVVLPALTWLQNWILLTDPIQRVMLAPHESIGFQQRHTCTSYTRSQHVGMSSIGDPNCIHSTFLAASLGGKRRQSRYF